MVSNERFETEVGLAISYLNQAMKNDDPRMILFYLRQAIARILDAMSAVL